MAKTTLDEETRAIARRQRIAEMLMQQGAEPLETNQMAGGYVVPVSPLAGVAKVAQQLSGAYIGKKADERASALHDKRLADLSGIDFNSPDAANQLAKNGMIEEAIKMRMKAAEDKSGTPGQWFIPAGAKPYKDDSGMTGYQLPDGSIIPNRFSQTEYQQNMTSPQKRGEVQAAISGNTVSKATNEQGQEFHDFNRNLNPAIAAGQPGAQQAPQIDISPEASAEDRAMLLEIAKKTGGNVTSQSAPVMSQTPAQKEASLIPLKAQEATNAADIANQKVIDLATSKKEQSGKNLLNLSAGQFDGKSIDDLIDESTGSGTGAIVDKIAALTGHATPGALASEQLKNIQGWMVSNVPRMEGPQSDFDVKNYQQMASNIGDPSVPTEIKKASFKTMQEIAARYAPDGKPVEQRNQSTEPSVADIEHTAKIHGMTVEQVKARLKGGK